MEGGFGGKAVMRQIVERASNGPCQSWGEEQHAFGWFGGGGCRSLLTSLEEVGVGYGGEETLSTCYKSTSEKHENHDIVEVFLLVSHTFCNSNVTCGTVAVTYNNTSFQTKL